MIQLTVNDIKNFCSNCLLSLNASFPNYADFFLSLYDFGLRPIELIELSRWGIKTAPDYKIKTAKNSNFRIIDSNDMCQDLRNRLNSKKKFYFPDINKKSPVFGQIINDKNTYLLNYNFLTSLFILSKPYPIFFSTSNYIELYIFRHNFIKQKYFVDNWTVQEISNYIGEKYNNNTQKYIDSKIFKN